MEGEAKSNVQPECTCPFCDIWAAYKKSDASKHVHGVQRETLLLMRSLLDVCLQKTEETLAGARKKIEKRA